MTNRHLQSIVNGLGIIALTMALIFIALIEGLRK